MDRLTKPVPSKERIAKDSPEILEQLSILERTIQEYSEIQCALFSRLAPVIRQCPTMSPKDEIMKTPVNKSEIATRLLDARIKVGSLISGLGIVMDSLEL